MQMTYEQAMRPGMLLAFATRRGSGYMMRSEKRDGAYGSPNRKPPKRKRAGFFYIFMTLLISVILWPVGMVMLWRRKVRLQAGTKLLISLLTLCLSIFLIVFALTVPVDNPKFTEFQDKANDWLDKAAVDAAAAGDAAIKKSAETWDTLTDFTEAGTQFIALHTADAIDLGVDAAAKVRTAVEGIFPHESAKPAETQAPADTDAPAEKATEAPAEEATEAPSEDATAIPATETAEAPEETAQSDKTEKPAFEIRLPDATPEAESARELGEGTLHANGEFEPGTVDAPTDAPAPNSGEALSQAIAEKVTEAPAEEATEAPEKETTEAPEKEAAGEATEAPTEKATEAPAEKATENPGEEAAATPTEDAAKATPEAPAEETTEAPAETETPAPDDGPYHVKPAGEATVYYYEKGSKGFHRTPTRHDMDGAPAHTLAEAFQSEKSPCQSCGMPDESILSVEHIAWVDEGNHIHTTDGCEQFEGEWRLMSLSEALDTGGKPCAACGADLYAEEIYPAPTPTPTPEVVNPSTPLKSAGEYPVYFFDASRGYHMAPSCVGMDNAPAHTLAEAQAAGKHACGHCFPPSTDLIDQPALWQDEKGVCHTSDDCAKFKGEATLIARDEALEQGLKACRKCDADEYLKPGTVLAK